MDQHPATNPHDAEAAMLAGYRCDPPPSGPAAAAAVTCPACGHQFRPAQPGELPRRVTETTGTAEAAIAGKRSYDDIKGLVRQALQDRQKAATGVSYAWVFVADLTDTDVVYGVDGDQLWQCPYQLAAGVVSLGDPVAVVPTYTAAGTVESAPASDRAERVTLAGRILEAKGADDGGGRVFRSRIIAYGDSANGRRYPENVMRAAAPLYEGAKAYDRHRNAAELTAGTIAGLVGYYRNVEATDAGLEADLHLLPSAAHAAEALDASLAVAGDGLAPLIGMSHDVMATFRPVVDGGRRLQEATAITRVLSADLVSDPAAGGKPTRAVAGGIDPDEPAPSGTETQEENVPVDTADVLAALSTATPEQLAAAGLAKAGTTTETTTATPPAPQPEPAQETGEPKGSFLGQLMIREKVKAAGLPEAIAESLAAELPDRIAESDVDARIAGLKAVLGIAERAGLAPTATAQVTQEARDKKVKALDAMFDRNYREGYRSFRQAYVDITGRQPRSFDEDFNRTILRESLGMYDSSQRAAESLTTASWDVILGDSVTRRMVADYGLMNLGTWRQIVSSIVPVNDFRTQRIDRVGGYGTLPTVNQAAPYQPLTSPTDEEASYAITKKGGTEDITLEMIANDDLRAITNVPRKLGRAAAQTLYRFVWDILPTNAAVSYDAVALFNAGHNNTTATAPLSQSNLSALRLKMLQQTAYGDASEVLGAVPKYLVVPSALEEIAFQLCTSAVAIPATPAGPSDTPNLHQNMIPVRIDYYTDANDWYIVADPAMVPTIEIGFYQGREDPELFTQADPTVGSMFDADKVTYKIRHIYSGAVLDHRGFQRATN
jgi:hypothetical protein